MYITILVGAISVFFAYLSRFLRNNWGLKISFIIIFIYLALRYEFGNDYEWYLISFNSLKEFDLVDFFEVILPYEPGWIFINWLFKKIGFFSLIIFTSLINCLLYYYLIKKFLPVKLYWLAVFIYFFLPNFMLLHSSAMRQSIAIIIFIYSWNFLLNKKPIKYFICIAVAITFHFSAVILIPCYIIVFLIDKKINFYWGVLIYSFYLSLFLFQTFWSSLIFDSIGNFNEKYLYYQNSATTNSGLGFLYFSVLFILTLYFEKKQTRDIQFIFKNSIVSFLIIPLALIIDMTGRLGMYFSPALIIVLPSIFKSLRNHNIKFIYISIIICITLFQFFQFMVSDNYSPFFYNYKTIFSSDIWQ